MFLRVCLAFIISLTFSRCVGFSEMITETYDEIDDNIEIDKITEDTTTENNDLSWVSPNTFINVFQSSTVQTNSEIGKSTTLESTQKNSTIKFQSNETYNEVNQESLIDNGALENNFSISSPFSTLMNEKIVLPRYHCNLEISVDETQEIKIQIKFESFLNNTSGKCCITLNGRRNSKLAVFITNIFFSSDKEILKVILTSSGVDFILKEYVGYQTDLPLLLTETHRVFIVLHYNTTFVPLNQKFTQFDLEVFQYGINENTINYHKNYKNDHYFFRKTGVNVENIFFTTENPAF